MSFKQFYTILNTKLWGALLFIGILVFVFCPKQSWAIPEMNKGLQSESSLRNPEITTQSIQLESRIRSQDEQAREKELRAKRLKQKSSSKIMDKSLRKWEEVKNVEYADSLSAKRVNLFVPTDIKDGSDGSQVQHEVLDQSLNSFVQGKLTPDLSLLRTVKQVEKSMQYDMVIAPSDEHGVKHKFNLQYMAFQNMAKLKYNGYMDANMKYFFGNSHVQAELAHPLSKTMQLSLTYDVGTIHPYAGYDDNIEVRDNTSMMHIQYHWN